MIQQLKIIADLFSISYPYLRWPTNVKFKLDHLEPPPL